MLRFFKTAVFLALVFSAPVLSQEAQPAQPPQAAVAPQPAPVPQPARKARTSSPSRAEHAYERGIDALDDRRWDQALELFEEAAKAGARPDGARYWKAYALNKLGRRDDALATLAELQRSFPESRWLLDSKALEVEIRQAAGQPPSPESQTDEELKLYALNALLNTEPERAIPLLDKILRGGHSPRLKERALFVLGQSKSPQAREIVLAIARGKSNPDFQLKALEYAVAASGTGARDLLVEVYAASGDLRVKRAILRGLAHLRERDRLLAVAREDKEPSLRREAVHHLGVLGAQAELKQIYAADTNREIRKAVIEAFFMQKNAPAIIEIARQETDPEMKKEAVRALSHMKSKEATEYLVELLSK